MNIIINRLITLIENNTRRRTEFKWWDNAIVNLGREKEFWSVEGGGESLTEGRRRDLWRMGGDSRLIKHKLWHKRVTGDEAERRKIRPRWFDGREQEKGTTEEINWRVVSNPTKRGGASGANNATLLIYNHE